MSAPASIDARQYVVRWVFRDDLERGIQRREISIVSAKDVPDALDKLAHQLAHEYSETLDAVVVEAVVPKMADWGGK